MHSPDEARVHPVQHTGVVNGVDPEAQRERGVRTLIYGSCISRDTFEYLPKDFHLVEYIARQSLISAAHPAPDSDPPVFEAPSSPFQRRMLHGDWNGSFFERLRKHAAKIDLLIWDLCDERLGVRRLARGRHSEADTPYVTRSVDSIRSGLDASLADFPVIPFASLRHRLLFNRALDRMRVELLSTGLLSKTVLLAPAWATHTESGRAAGTSFGMSTVRANRVFGHYAQAVSLVTGVRTIARPPTSVRAGDNHRWGAAPFHYSPAVYTDLARDLERFARDPAAPRVPTLR